MKKKSIQEIYEIYLSHPKITKDSRQISEGCIYFSLSGENFDGNKFAEDAIKKGAAFAVVDKEEYCKGDRYLLVEDSLECLQELARHHRRKLNIPIIGITGSNGKTTTKELIHAVLASHYKTFATAGNYNNHIGVPLSILSINKEHEMAVIEMGANHQGEIDFLSHISMPNYGMITNIGKAHLEGFGGIEGVKKGKSELYRYLEKVDGLVFLNADDPVLEDLAEKNSVLRYGTSAEADCKAELEQAQPILKGSWQFGDFKGTIDAKIYGSYNFYNMLAAICIGNYFKVPAEKIDKAVNSYESENNRSEIRKVGDHTIYLDAYNANPSSMRLAIDNFKQLSVAQEDKILILGDMFELGTDSKIEHMEIIAHCQAQEFGKVLFVGKHFSEVAAKQNALSVETTAEAKNWYKQQKKEGAHILIKGSRGMALEKILAD
ncbi:MAG: UDP-N-acetylmuramoyl-tripeptide--D-alanyl-D-alanine ligase [Flavobacteriales bacterium]|nr:UDP-N-acetylmuramoyl-tripeptide--D-alanyl-D-alanine ligase [Flavobacteriales bacterium]